MIPTHGMAHGVTHGVAQNINPEYTYWFVWNPARGSPTFWHRSEQSARSEAERLARGAQGERFWVLCAKGSVVVHAPMQWTRCTKDEIPF